MLLESTQLSVAMLLTQVVIAAGIFFLAYELRVANRQRTNSWPSPAHPEASPSVESVREHTRINAFLLHDPTGRALLTDYFLSEVAVAAHFAAEADLLWSQESYTDYEKRTGDKNKFITPENFERAKSLAKSLIEPILTKINDHVFGKKG